MARKHWLLAVVLIAFFGPFGFLYVSIYSALAAVVVYAAAGTLLLPFFIYAMAKAQVAEMVALLAAAIGVWLLPCVAGILLIRYRAERR